MVRPMKSKAQSDGGDNAYVKAAFWFILHFIFGGVWCLRDRTHGMLTNFAIVVIKTVGKVKYLGREVSYA